MIIAAAEKRKKRLTEVFCNDESVLIDSETFLLSKLKVGDEISYEQLETLKYKSNYNRAKQKALWLLSKRDYAKKELISKLLKDYEKDAANEAVERLCEVDLVNDERFAKRYANYLLSFKSLSPKAIKQELKLKGIDRELAEQIADELEVDAKSTISELIERKYKNSLSDEKGVRRVYSALLRKGYSYDDVRTALNEYIERECL